MHMSSSSLSFKRSFQTTLTQMSLPTWLADVPLRGAIGLALLAFAMTGFFLLHVFWTSTQVFDLAELEATQEDLLEQQEYLEAEVSSLRSLTRIEYSANAFGMVPLTDVVRVEEVDTSLAMR